MTNHAEQAKGREALHRALPSARFYDVGGRQLMLYASGTGGPVVVFLPGAGVTGLGYLKMEEVPGIPQLGGDGVSGEPAGDR